MSITIISQPTSSLLSANNDSFFVVSGSAGTTSSVFDFKYLADIYVNGNRVTTLKSFPDPQYGYGVFNLRNITPNFVSYDAIYTLAQDQQSVFHTASNSSTNVQLYYGKEYSYYGGFSQSRGEISGSVFTYLNSALDFTEAVTTNLSGSYLIGNSSSNASFLTKANFPIPTFTNLRNYLYYYLSSSVQTYLSISTYDAYGNNVGSYYVINPYYNVPGVQIVATGYSQLGMLVSGSGINGSYAVNTGNSTMFGAGVTNYTIQLAKGGLQPLTKAMTYQIETDCSKFAPYAWKAYWINALGGMDSFIFNKGQTITRTKTQSLQKKIPGILNANGTYLTNTYSQAVIPYYTELTTQLQLSTDFLSDNAALYLKGLYESPVIFLENPSGVLISATIDPSNPYTLNYKAINKKTFSVQMNFIPSNSDVRQAQ